MDAIFKDARSAKEQARETVRTIARMGLNDPEALTLREIEMICQALIDQA